MVNITKGDKFMGAALEVSFPGGERPRVDGHRIMAFSVDSLRAFADVGLEGSGIGYWELTAEQAGELLERAPGLQLASEFG